MSIDLDIFDLVNMIKGVIPLPNARENNMVQKAGIFIDGEWKWFGLGSLTRDQLINIYQICKRDYVINNLTN